MTTTTAPLKKPKKKKKNEAARALVKLRWKKTTPKERSQIGKWLNTFKSDPAQERCPCGVMTMKRAQTRSDVNGTGLGHEPGCSFYRKEPRRKTA